MKNIMKKSNSRFLKYFIFSMLILAGCNETKKSPLIGNVGKVEDTYNIYDFPPPPRDLTPIEFAQYLVKADYIAKYLNKISEKRNENDDYVFAPLFLTSYLENHAPSKFEHHMTQLLDSFYIKDNKYFLTETAGRIQLNHKPYKIALSQRLDYYLLEGFDVDNFYRMMSDMTNDFRYAKTLEKTIQMVNQIYITPGINQSELLTGKEAGKYRPIRTEQDSVITYKFYMKRVDSASGAIEQHRLEIDHKYLRIRIDGTDIVHQSEKLNLPISQRE